MGVHGRQTDPSASRTSAMLKVSPAARGESVQTATRTLRVPAGRVKVTPNGCQAVVNVAESALPVIAVVVEPPAAALGTRNARPAASVGSVPPAAQLVTGAGITSAVPVLTITPTRSVRLALALSLHWK